MYFLNILFSLAYFIISVQYIICIIYKMCVNQLFMLLASLEVNRVAY